MDDVFAEMKAEAARAMASHQNGALISKAKHSKKGDSVEALMAQAEAKEALKKKKEKKEKKERKEKIAAASKAAMDIIQAKQGAKKAEAETTSGMEVVTATKRDRVETDAKTVMAKIARDVNSLSDESQAVRRPAIDAIYNVLFVDFSLSVEDYGEVFSDICKPVFKRFADPVEKIREKAFKITASFFDAASDFTLVLGYFIPALMARVPSGMAYDEEMKVFVTDLESHEAYRRGKAVERADKANLGVATVVEPSEELRRMGCEVLLQVVVKLCQTLDAASILHPYYHEIVVYIARQLRDPYGDVKILACDMLTVLMEVDDFNGGNKYFSVALCRSLYPVMRHRLARVRVAAVNALTVTMAVEDRAKLKGSGTEALPDMVGFREENVLPVASFYTADVQINYLAEVIGDSNHAVRQAVANLLRVFMTEMKDRYDHHTRLLPYLLDLLTDPNEHVRDSALKTLQLCGKQYEEEHHDEIIERRQYGVDGDRRINLDDPLPAPFTESGRPRLGVRLFVRGQIKRFLSALIAEVTNWIGTTRLKSANLLKMVVVLVEEHLTVEAHMILPAFIKALGFARGDDDRDLVAVLLEVFTLTGRYLLPEVYVHYILPRLSGDPKVVQFGVDAKTREEVLMILGCLLRGSQPREIAPHFGSIMTALTDPFVIDITSTRTHAAAAELMHVLLLRMAGHGKAAIEGHFLSTGRLTSLRGTVVACFRWLWAGMCDNAGGTRTHLAVTTDSSSSGSGSGGGSGTEGTLLTRLAACAVLLSQLDRDSDSGAGAGTGATLGYLASMIRLQGTTVISSLVGADGGSTGDNEPYTQGEDAELEQQQQRQMLALAGSPFMIVQRDPALLQACLSFAIEVASGKRGNVDTLAHPHTQITFRFLSDLVAALLAPLAGGEGAGGTDGDAVHGALMSAASSASAPSGDYPSSDTTSTPLRCATESQLSAGQVDKAREVVAPKMKVLLQLFAMHSRWGYSGLSSGLYGRMARLVRLLVAPIGGCEGESEGDNAQPLLPASAILDIGAVKPLLEAILLVSPAPSSASASASARAREGAVAASSATLILQAPTSTRREAAQLSCLLGELCVGAFWAGLPYGQRKAVPFASAAAKADSLGAMRRSLATMQGTLLLLLDDADQAVRNAAAEGLAATAALVSPDAQEEPGDSPKTVTAGMRKIEISVDSEDEDEDEDEDESKGGGGADGGGSAVIRDLSATELPPATLTRILASSLRALLGTGTGTGTGTGAEALGSSALAQTVRTLCVLDPVGVERALNRLEPSGEPASEGEGRDTGGGVLMAGVLMPSLAPLTPGQRAYKEELGPVRELQRELLDHCALLKSLPTA